MADTRFARERLRRGSLVVSMLMVALAMGAVRGGMAFGTTPTTVYSNDFNLAPTTVYSNDFGTSIGPEWSGAGILDTPSADRVLASDVSGCWSTPSGTVCGDKPFGSDTATLTLTGLPAHSAVELSFKLYTVRSWDGNDPHGFGPDFWDLDVTDVASDIQPQTTFSNYPGYTQDYPDPYVCTYSEAGCVVPNAGTTGSAATGDLLGLGTSGNGEIAAARYDLDYSFDHTASDITFTFTASLTEGWADEGWVLDDVVVTVTPNIQDTSAAATYDITTTASADAITVQDGPVVDGFRTVEIYAGGVGYDLANKTTITVNAGDGADAITIDNPTAADGVSSITVNGQGDDDTAHVIATASGITTTVDTGGGTGDVVDVGSTLNGIAGELDLSDAGDGGAVTLDDSSDTTQNVATISAGSVVTTYVTGASPGEIDVTGMASIALALGSGRDTLRVQGTDPSVSYDLDLGGGGDALAMLGSASIASGSPIEGGGGTDTVKYTKYSIGVTMDLSAGTATGTPGVAGFENVTGSAFSDTLTGDGGPNTIVGTGGGDTMSGLGQDDLLTGTAGPDTISGGDGNDRMNGAGGDDHLMGDAGNDRMAGGAGADTAEGGDGNDRLGVKDGVQGNDTADGGPNTDTCVADSGDTVVNCEA